MTNRFCTVIRPRQQIMRTHLPNPNLETQYEYRGNRNNTNTNLRLLDIQAMFI